MTANDNHTPPPPGTIYTTLGEIALAFAILAPAAAMLGLAGAFIFLGLTVGR